MTQTVKISDEEKFQELIETYDWLGTDVDTRVIRLMVAGDKFLSEEPYRPNKRHEDCMFLLYDTIKTRYKFEQISMQDVLYASATVALASPDEVVKELLQDEKYTI